MSGSRRDAEEFLVTFAAAKLLASDEDSETLCRAATGYRRMTEVVRLVLMKPCGGREWLWTDRASEQVRCGGCSAINVGIQVTISTCWTTTNTWLQVNWNYCTANATHVFLTGLGNKSFTPSIYSIIQSLNSKSDTIFECLFIFSVSKLLLNAVSYDGELWHADAWQPRTGFLFVFVTTGVVVTKKMTF